MAKSIVKEMDGRFELTEAMPDSQLFNKDLAPVPFAKRTWGYYEFIAIWVGMSVCVPTWMLGASMVDSGFNWAVVVGTIALGNIIVLIPMILNSFAGAKYGIPFPVFLRSAFGIYGANIPALLRAIVAIGWFGIQTMIMAFAIDGILVSLSPAGFGGMAGTVPFFNLNAHTVISFMISWIMTVAICYYSSPGKSAPGVKWLNDLAAPVLLLIGVGLLWWGYTESSFVLKIANALSEQGEEAAKALLAGRTVEMKEILFASAQKIVSENPEWLKGSGWGPILSQPTTAPWAKWPGFLTAMVAYWATLAINISDLTRFAKNQKVQYVGQTLGMPTTMTLYSFIGVAVTSATVIIYGAAIWDPVALMIKTQNVLFIYVGLIFVILATLTTNIAANMIAPINDVMHVYPKKLNWEVTTIIISLIGILMQPWRFLADPNAYIWTWLLGYGAFLGPIAGVVIADFWLIRKQTIKLDDIYKNNGYYDFKKTANPIMTVLLGICSILIVFFYTQGIILGARTIITEKYKMLVTFDMAIINEVITASGWPALITTAVLVIGVLGAIYLGYSKIHGVNMVGAVSLFLGIVVSMGLPLLIPAAGMWTWFIGLFVSLILYYVLYPAWYGKVFSPVPK